jgi:hypothetical protein
MSQPFEEAIDPNRPTLRAREDTRDRLVGLRLRPLLAGGDGLRVHPLACRTDRFDIGPRHIADRLRLEGDRLAVRGRDFRPADHAKTPPHRALRGFTTRTAVFEARDVALDVGVDDIADGERRSGIGGGRWFWLVRPAEGAEANCRSDHIRERFGLGLRARRWFVGTCARTSRE